jgi:hypothetical protein
MQQQSAQRLLVGVNETAPKGGGSCGSIGARAQLALLLMLTIAIGTMVGLLVVMTGYEQTQAHALAPQTQGSNAMAYCLVCDDGFTTGGSGFSSKVTSALQKGCTLVGGKSPAALGGVYGSQAMLCPAGMVHDGSEKPGYDGSVCQADRNSRGQCITA